MFSVRPLKNSQSEFGGSAACTVCCCTLARFILRFRDQIDVSADATLGHFDKAIWQGTKAWELLGAGFLYPAEVLPHLPVLGLRIVDDIPTCVTGDQFDELDDLVVRSTADVLFEWLKERSHDTVCLAVRGGYTFMLFRLKATHVIIDTHANSILRHGSKLSTYAQVQEDTTGLLLSTIFFKEVVKFILEYAPLDTADRSASNSSSNQIDLTYLGLVEKPP